MSQITPVEAITIIAAVAAALVSIINAIANGWGRKAIADVKTEVVTRGERADQQLEHIKELTNGGLHVVKEKLREALDKVDTLTERLAVSAARIDGLERQLRGVEKRKDAV